MISLPGCTPVSQIIPKKRLVCGIEGLQRSGKTHLALTAEPPIVIINIDRGLEGMSHKFNHKEIHQKEIPRPDPLSGNDFLKAWNDFIAIYKSALAHPQVRTVIIDTATEMWDLVRLARLGKLTNIIPVKYTEVNNEMRDMVGKAMDSDKDVIFLSQVGEGWTDNKKSGKMERKGFDALDYLVQINIETSYDVKEKCFQAVIRDCRQNMGLCGMPIKGALLDYPTIKNMVLG